MRDYRSNLKLDNFEPPPPPNHPHLEWSTQIQALCVGYLRSNHRYASGEYVLNPYWHSDILPGRTSSGKKIHTHTHRVHNVVYLRDESLSLRCWRHTQSPRTCKREHIYYIHLQAIWQRVNQIHFWALQIKVLSMHAQYVSCVYVWFECEWAMVNTVDAAQYISHIRRISGPKFVLARGTTCACLRKSQNFVVQTWGPTWRHNKHKQQHTRLGEHICTIYSVE